MRRVVVNGGLGLASKFAKPSSLDVVSAAAAAPACLAVSRRSFTRHEIPDKLKDMPEQANPSFFEMVEYFFHRGWQVVEEKLVDEMPGKQSRDKKIAKVQGTLNIIRPCHHLIEINFPLKRDDGSLEMIQGFRAQHSQHRTPCKGGECSTFDHINF